MDKYYKWDGTLQGVEGLKIFLGVDVQFDPDTNCVSFFLNEKDFVLSAEETIVLLAEGDALFVGVDGNVDTTIAQYRAASRPPLNSDASLSTDEPEPPTREGSFGWALGMLAKGASIRCKMWKEGRLLTAEEADDGEWELA